MPWVFPDYKAPIVRNGAVGRELALARWGMPSSQHALMEAMQGAAHFLLSLILPTEALQEPRWLGFLLLRP